MIDWFKRWWWVPLAVAGLVALAFRVASLKRQAAAATAVVALDRERGVQGAKIKQARAKAAAAQKEAEVAVGAMKQVAEKLRDADHEKLAEIVDQWY